MSYFCGYQKLNGETFRLEMFNLTSRVKASQGRTFVQTRPVYRPHSTRTHCYILWFIGCTVTILDKSSGLIRNRDLVKRIFDGVPSARLIEWYMAQQVSLHQIATSYSALLFSIMAMFFFLQPQFTFSPVHRISHPRASIDIKTRSIVRYDSFLV
jgi:hypothetical protein